MGRREIRTARPRSSHKLLGRIHLLDGVAHSSSFYNSVCNWDKKFLSDYRPPPYLLARVKERKQKSEDSAK